MMITMMIVYCMIDDNDNDDAEAVNDRRFVIIICGQVREIMMI